MALSFSELMHEPCILGGEVDISCILPLIGVLDWDPCTRTSDSDPKSQMY